ncbi:hypothetical protein [Robbsia sp. KACC 23696]
MIDERSSETIKNHHFVRLTAPTMFLRLAANVSRFAQQDQAHRDADYPT